MKKVLMLSYYFPPLGMGGTQRPAKFAHFLRDFGWEPTVLTVKPVSYWATDTTLLADVAEIHIVRTGSLDPQRLLGVAQSLRRRSQSGGSGPEAAATEAQNGFFLWLNRRVVPWLLLPDSKILWRWHARRAAARLLRSGDYAAIWTTSPPHSTHLIGRRLARRFRLPWVADLRDAWASSVVVHEPTRWHRWRQQRLMARVARAADTLVGVTPGIVRQLEAAGAAGKVVWIPNGFDAADFPAAGLTAASPIAGSSASADDLAATAATAATAAEPAAGLTAAPAGRPRTTFQLCHCGSITRFSNPAPLFAALQPGPWPGLRLRFVGYDANGAFNAQLHSQGVAGMTDYCGYLSHKEALAAMMAADALLLIACDDPEARFIPGKSFEYLASGKPILLISNVKETLQLFASQPGVLACDPAQPPQIRAALERLTHDPALAQAALQRDLRLYERRYQAGQLAGLLDQLVKSASWRA